MSYKKIDWYNLGIEDCNYYELAKFIIPEDCEFPIRYKDNFPISDIYSFQNSERPKYAPQFVFMSKQEAKDLLNGVWDENKVYTQDEDMPCGIYFPNCTLKVAERYFPEFCNETVDRKLEQYFYENNYLMFAKRCLYRTVFYILHEYGHYQLYKRLGSKIAYYNFFCKEKIEYNKKVEAYEESLNKTKEEEDRLHQLYRELPDEKEADDYALEHLEETMERVIEYLRAKVLESNN